MFPAFRRKTGPPRQVYFVCTTSRSGSSYLCDLLDHTGVMGKPKEFFNVAALDEQIESMGARNSRD
ncbi:MAG: Stf0 family sulfotransferase, partial [Verrucomicrobiota bacterium]